MMAGQLDLEDHSGEAPAGRAPGLTAGMLSGAGRLHRFVIGASGVAAEHIQYDGHDRVRPHQADATGDARLRCFVNTRRQPQSQTLAGLYGTGGNEGRLPGSMMSMARTSVKRSYARAMPTSSPDHHAEGMTEL